MGSMYSIIDFDTHFMRIFWPVLDYLLKLFSGLYLAKIVIGLQNNFSSLFVDPKHMFGVVNLVKKIQCLDTTAGHEPTFAKSHIFGSNVN